MSTHLKEKLEKISELLERLAIESSKGIPIIVEGPKDVDTLRKLAFSGEIIPAKTRKSILEVSTEIENFDSEEVILLMDFDRRGKELTSRLTKYLEQTTTKPNTFYWREMQSLLSHDIKDIESILPYLHTLKRKIGDSQTIIEANL